MDLVGKRVLVTGGTAGIGFAVAQQFAKKGANIILSYAHNDERANIVKEDLEKYGGIVHVVKATSSTKEGRKFLQDSCIKIGKIDVLVNNVGKAFPDIDEETSVWEAMFQHHFMSTVDMTERFVAQVGDVMGCVVNISSVAGTEPLSWYKVARNESYCCVKSMIETYTRIMANTYIGKTRIVAVSPGNTKTPGRNRANQEIIDARINGTLIHRFVAPEEIGSTVLHVVENDAINGHTFVVDGGVVAKGYETL